MTEAEAIALAESEFWKDLTPRQRATFQLFEPRLCMPFAVFQEALEETLGRPVWTHEIALNYDGIKAELLGESPPPTMEEIMNLIPPEKRLVVSIG